MTKDQVQVGKVYAVKVSGNVVPVRLERESPYGGWNGFNITTGRVIRVRTAAKLRYEVEAIQNGWRKVGGIEHVRFS